MSKTEIYKITNLVNGKVYIGQSARGVQQRFVRHIQDAISGRLDTHFARAIRKYGENNFIVESMDTADTQEELNQKEQYWIHEYDSIRHGYNETDAACKCGGNTYMSKNKYEMREIGEKIRDSKLGALNPNARKIKCRSEATGEELIFDTVNECREYFGEKNHRFITTRASHDTHSLYQREWNFAYLDEPYHDLEEYPIRRTRVKLLLTNLATNRTREYSSMNALAKILGIPLGTLQKKIRRNDGHVVINNYQIDVLN